MASNGLHLADKSLVNFLLYDNDTLNFEENKSVLTATLKFIHESSRFDIENEYDIEDNNEMKWNEMKFFLVPPSPPPPSMLCAGRSDN